MVKLRLEVAGVVWNEPRSDYTKEQQKPVLCISKLPLLYQTFILEITIYGQVKSAGDSSGEESITAQTAFYYF